MRWEWEEKANRITRSGNFFFFFKAKKEESTIKSREKDELLKTKFCSWDFVMGAVIAIDLFYLLFFVSFIIGL